MSTFSTFKRKAFYLPSANGKLFCLHYLPNNKITSHILIFPPFAEELNRCRHIMSHTAVQLAENGHSVLIIDLFGTGDSEGDFIDASWEIWKINILQAIEYLRQQDNSPINFISIRLGALLALDILTNHSSTVKADKLIAWQPVFNPAKYIRQFLSLYLANQMLRTEKTTIEAIQKEIKHLGSLEIAGYPLSATLMDSILNVSKLTKFDLSATNAISIFQISSNNDADFLPDTQKFALSQQIHNLQIKLIQGKAFWQNYGIQTCPQLVEQTLIAINAQKDNTRANDE